MTWKALLFTVTILALGVFGDYPCAWNYAGNCYDCLYNFDTCHRALPHAIYTDGKIYTVDDNDTDWRQQ